MLLLAGNDSFKCLSYHSANSHVIFSTQSDSELAEAAKIILNKQSVAGCLSVLHGGCSAVSQAEPLTIVFVGLSPSRVHSVNSTLLPLISITIADSKGQL